MPGVLAASICLAPVTSARYEFAPPWSSAQQVSLASLADRSTIILRGTIQKVNASIEPLMPASNRTVVVKVSKVYVGESITGNIVGSLATIEMSSTGAKAGTDMVFFGVPRFIGKSLTMSAFGQVTGRVADASKADFTSAVQGRIDLPVRLVLREASQVFRGKVVKVEPIEREAKDLDSEHDPEWQMATVAVETGMKSVKQGQTVHVLFANSRDIVWYASPKFKEGDEGVFITRNPKREEAILMRETGALEMIDKMKAVLLTDNAAFQPASQMEKVRTLMAKEIGR
ncbi:MAG: hypothetical protein JST51_01965 [Armatimonadetes bacterium]|nr:hypothetical protein [Armatimonadota bacterium]